MVMRTLFFLLTSFTLLFAQSDWHQVYKKGIEAMKMGNYPLAIVKFEKCIKDKAQDKKKIRTYGMHFMKYFPNREIGIAHYYLGNIPEARKYLQRSLTQAPSARAREFLNRTSKSDGPPAPKKYEDAIPGTENPLPPPPKPSPNKIKLVGERMSIAVLPFENKGASRDLGDIIFDKLTTALFNKGRFIVIERLQLETILKEHQLGASGLIDASTAVELGRGLGVDAIILGGVAATSSGSISIDARAINTETAAIIVAHDSYSSRSDQQSVKNAVNYLADKFVSSLPLIAGTVMRMDGGGIMLDIGRNGGIKKGIKCIIYREGNEIIHPESGENMGKETTIIGEVLVTDPFDKYSSGRVLKTEAGQMITIGDKFITK